MHYLCTLDLPDAWFAELERRLPDVVVGRAAHPGPDALHHVELLHTSAWFPASAEDVPALRGVQLDTSGVDHVRPTWLWGSGLPIATLGGIAPVPMAEYALMAILELAHRMPRIQQHRAERSWPSDAERLARLTPLPMHGSTLGIVGYGRIGREIARLGSAFGMRVLGVRRGSGATAGERFDTGRSGATEHAEVVAMDGIDEVIAASDVLVVVVPLTELTRGMIDARRLDLLPRGAVVVNIARGGIVDEAALLERLRDGRVDGVALDVFDDEPLPPASPWWSEPGALVTPHVAGLAPRYHAQTLDLVVENLTRLAEGRPLMNEVDRVTGY